MSTTWIIVLIVVAVLVAVANVLIGIWDARRKQR